MVKRLVVCCDGSWNNAGAKTHIHWIFENCRTEGDRPVRQLPAYIAGVGTRAGEILTGGALGLGLSRNVREAYSFVRDNWEPGDELFVFGFSRGAYTARSLCGFLRKVGMLSDPKWVDLAYLWYRLSRPGPDQQEPSLLLRLLAKLVQGQITNQADVTFLGVFDTVGSLGIPFKATDLAIEFGVDKLLDAMHLGMFGMHVNLVEDEIRRPIEGFHDTELGPHVKNAYHALAIDERRGPFVPTLWTKVPPTSTVEQSWFAGVHGDVGGNYHAQPDDAHLAGVPLLWMMEKATALGLELKPGAVDELRRTADPQAPQHDSLSKGWEILFEVSPVHAVQRPIGNAARRQVDPDGHRFPLVEANETIHASVRQRLDKEVEIRFEDDRPAERRTYHPLNLPAVL